ncbi:protein phosphatase 2C domain-containing protein [Shewanella sp. 1_MG-2023]|uniref:PP2C family protein-serine/threonine phosphatase n=1 Tax=unclassified Shewanella TaxID=196818 RepID=UPI0026E43D59|nr:MULTISPECIES: protein phosphatase 2C domain-containing protein [unclassified Shewanella]MDO6610653.1 protein phosphatase 2C domain-containing protein [Shewanella sp. 7_MG-2023]MDO6770778.1 protein phosphatase 2C domain-containing protein [Shewanella sp. 2_MG-2023]MDO6793204.1 protein phosphatase 2C domain-containing protein [Shewanella sp. 1_MG-2023]
MQYDSLSIVGPRVDNQDSLQIQKSEDITFACIADGVGGNAGGSVASQLSVKKLMEAFESNIGLSLELFANIDSCLKQAALQDDTLHGMASTLSACAVTNGRLIIGHCGDSRIMLLRKNGIKQLTPDHSEVEKLIREGILSRKEAVTYPRKNVLESALGASKELLFFGGEVNLEVGDRILLTTDGVHGVFSKRELRDLSLQASTPAEFISLIVNAGLEARATDNASLIVIDI